MSLKSERKKAIKAEKQAQEKELTLSFNLENESSVPTEVLKFLLMVGAEAADVHIPGIYVHAVDSTDKQPELHGEDILHLPVPPKGDDPLHAVNELFRRIIVGLSFIADAHAQKTGLADLCNACIAARVEQHHSILERIAPIYNAESVSPAVPAA